MARIAKITHQQIYDGQLVLNTYTYVADGDIPADDLCQGALNAIGVVDAAGAFTGAYTLGSLAQAVQDFQRPQVDHVLWRAITPYDVQGLYEVVLPAGIQGLRDDPPGATPLAPFIAATIRSNRLRRDVRRGFKRYVGLSEADVSVNTLEDSNQAFTRLQGIADAASAPLTGATQNVATITLSPAVVPLFKNPTPPPAYELFQTEAEAVQGAAIGIAYAPIGNITTQNSRKRGRGA